MDSSTSVFQVYNELADWYEQKGPPSMRDRFLVLAADAALTEGDVDVAESLRERLLYFNPHHLLKPYASLVQALGAADVQTYVGDLRRNYPPEAARQLLLSLRDRDDPTTRAIPPTAPLIHFDDDEVEGTARLEPAPELLKVYPLRPEVDQTEILPPPRPSRPRRDATPPPQSAAPTRTASSAPTAPAPRSPTSFPRQSTPLPPPISMPRRPPALPPPSAEPDEPTHGSWLGVALCGLIIAVGVALSGYSLLRPFLPSSWLP
jgi:hypothetical protein